MISLTNSATILSLWLVGFSVISAILLLVTHFRCASYQGKSVSRFAGIALLLSLAGIQIGHYFFLQNAIIPDHFVYKLCLFTVAPAFYFFSREHLKASTEYSHWQWLHLIPIIISPFIPWRDAQIGSFLLGGGYVAWLAYTIYQLRDQRSRFKLELLALAIMFAIALSVLVLGLLIPLISTTTFYTYYAINIGLAFFVVLLILLYSPDITTEVAEAAQASYTATTLQHIDIDKALRRLDQVMQQDQLYSNENLTLQSVAEVVNLTPHQLSELINRYKGISFSHYLRECRVNAAKKLLLDEPKASILAIGMEVGFTSQSNFYAAFRQLEDMAPGQFRKQHKQEHGKNTGN